MADIKNLFEQAVSNGKTEFRRKADWSGICESVRANKVFLDEYPRIKTNNPGSDVITVDVNGTKVVLQGTSNLNDEERARYYQKSDGSIRTRSSSAPVQQTANKAMLVEFLSTHTEWNTPELLMLLKMTGAKDMLIQYIQTKDTWNLNELLLLVQM